MGQEEFLDHSQISAKLYLGIFGLLGSHIYHNEIKVAENHSVKRDLSRTQVNSLIVCDEDRIDIKTGLQFTQRVKPNGNIQGRVNRQANNT